LHIPNLVNTPIYREKVLHGVARWGCDFERHGNRVAVPLSADNQLTVHDVAWQIGKVTSGRRVGDNQPAFLNPTSARVNPWASFGLVKISRQEMHDDCPIQRRNLGDS